MKKIKYFKPTTIRLLLCVGITICFAFTGQTLKQQLKKELAGAYAFYREQQVLYMHSTVYGVPVRNAGGQVKIGTAEMYRDGYRFYSKALGREMYCEGKRALVIQHQKKLVTLYQNFDTRRMMREQTLPLDSLLKRIDGRDSLVQPGGKTNVYRLYAKNNRNVYTDLVFDEKEHYLRDYHYTVYTGEELQSDYSKIKVHYDQVSKKLPKKIDFSIDRFLEGMGNKLKVNAKLLKGYKLKVRKYYYEDKY